MTGQFTDKWHALAGRAGVATFNILFLGLLTIALVCVILALLVVASLRQLAMQPPGKGADSAADAALNFTPAQRR